MAIDSAERLTQRLDALSTALRKAGVSPERSARLLGAAAEATMHAVTLEVLLEERPARPASGPRAAVVAEREPEAPVTLAA